MPEKIAIIGSGLIGRAWAISFARGGYSVALFDESVTALDSAAESIATAVKDLEPHDLLHGNTVAEILDRIKPVASLPDAVDGAIHVQENVPEKVDIKVAVFAQLDELAAPGTVLASSTSAILPSAFTERLAGRERCLVVHPINPPYLVPACEVVPAPWTSPQVVEQTRQRLESIGQAPLVMRKELHGFLMNRLQGAVVHEAFRLVAGGYASVADIDRGLSEGIGLRWSFIGPFETADLNAPGGVRDYVDRYGPLYREMANTQSDAVDWSGDLLDEIERERSARLPRDQIAKRQEWRDRRLMGLIAHKHAADTSPDSATKSDDQE